MGIEKFTPTKFNYSAHHSEENFERTCIRTLNKVWIPSLSFSQLEKIFSENDPEGIINYSWYSSRVYFSNLSVPDLTFAKLKTAWSINLHDLLKKEIRKTELYKKWEEQPSNGFVFPIVGSQAILYESFSPPEFNSVIQKFKDKYLVISLLQDYATFYHDGVLVNE